MSLPVYVTAATVLCAGADSWRGLAARIAAGAVLSPSTQLQASHGLVWAAEIKDIPAKWDVEPRMRKWMSYPARLAAMVLNQLCHESNWSSEQRAAAALFLGVGASGCPISELTQMLKASIQQQQFELTRFGGAGLAACSPLLAFQLMNNFSLCHGAILTGLAGPNSAFFSRGTGTVAALAEAYWLVASGQSELAIAGGADSALHPVTWSQLVRDSWVACGLVPGEGAAVLALSPERQRALARLERVQFASALAIQSGLTEFLAAFGPVDPQRDWLVLAPWGPPARQLLASFSHTFAAERQVDISAALAETLAAAPALAVAVALDLLASRAQRVWVASAGIDGGVGLVLLSAG